jgi:hypothetical protein
MEENEVFILEKLRCHEMSCQESLACFSDIGENPRFFALFLLISEILMSC